MKKKSVKVNALMNTILSMSAFIFPLITFPYIADTLGVKMNGKINSISTIVTYFSMFAQLGIPTYGVRICAQNRKNKEELSRITQEILFINLITAVFAYVVLGGITIFIPELYSDKWLILVMSSIILLNAIGVEWLYKALEEYTYITKRSIFFKLVSIVLMFILVHKPKDYMWYGAILIFASSASNIMNLINLKKYVTLKPVGNYNFKRHYKPIFIFFALTVATTIYTNLDIVMLRFMKGENAVSYYSTAVKIKTILVSLVTSVSAVLLPKASIFVKEKRMKEFYEIIEKVLDFSLLISLPVVIFFSFFAREGIYFIANYKFAKAITPMVVIMPSIVFIAFTAVTGYQLLVPLGKEKNVLYSSIVGALVDLVLNIIFIPKFGPTGASIGTLAAEIAVFVVQFCSMTEVNIKLFKKISYGKIIIANVLAFVAVFLIKDIPLNIKSRVQDFIYMAIVATVFFGVYGVVLLVSKEKLVKELSTQLWDMVNRRKK
ncbi:flippase [Lachnobacterium bovis]|uniref:Membrane protein involved in the export of O-antigen and teichoic acid n=1 Tax=Lachnobacterium bovis TaxID=140626 RepID=A0A1H9NZX8_9FIRM|nr:flippase [Lachnobacterium bovis]SER41215.1 Membrane protein involved in the export of O-antigen and teichoic acid [Lachnobacterium bovis]